MKTFDDLSDDIAIYFKVEKSKLLGYNRTIPVKQARHVLYYIAMVYLDLSCIYLARHTGKHYTSVLHGKRACFKSKYLMKHVSIFAETFGYIMTEGNTIITDMQRQIADLEKRVSILEKKLKSEQEKNIRLALNAGLFRMPKTIN